MQFYSLHNKFTFSSVQIGIRTDPFTVSPRFSTVAGIDESGIKSCRNFITIGKCFGWMHMDRIDDAVGWSRIPARIWRREFDVLEDRNLVERQVEAGGNWGPILLLLY
jgi:hypothetical protein